MNASSITQTPMREAAMERLLKDVLGYPKDETIMRDQHDPTTQPSLQGQIVDRRTRCGACGRLQPLPAMWPTCRRCETEICPACRVTGSVDAHQWRCDCTACVPAETAPPADSVLVDQVAAVLVRAIAAARGETSVPFDELPPAQRQRYRDVGRIAWSLCDPEAIRIAHWIAADRLIWERTGCYGWKGADGKARRQAWADARLAVTSARQFWMGLLAPEFASEARRALKEVAEGTVAPFAPSAFLTGGNR